MTAESEHEVAPKSSQAYAYLAGVFDTRGALGVRFTPSESSHFNLYCTPILRLNLTGPRSMAAMRVESVCDAFDIEYSSRVQASETRSNTYRWETTDSDDIETLLSKMEPYLLATLERSAFMREEVLPFFESEYPFQSEDEFVRAAEYGMDLRFEHGGRTKYTPEKVREIVSDRGGD